VFNIASVSKQFTATSVLLLAEAGRLSLDDDVRKYVPELRDYGKVITLRMLGNHTSGLRDYPGLLALGGWNWVDEVPMARALDVITRQKELNFLPGERYAYSNAGYVLLAIVVQRVSGQSLGQYAAEHIFQPLGMLHTRFYDDRRMIMKGRAVGHIKRDDDSIGVWRPTYELVGDGGVLTTVQDLALWERNFLEPRLGGEPARLVAQLTQPARLNDGSAIEYGFGLELSDYRGLHLVGHGGSIPGYAAFVMRFPEQQLSVQLLCNLGNLPARKLAHSVAELYLGSVLQAAPAAAAKSDESKAPRITLTPQQLAIYAGDFYSTEIDATHHVQVQDGALSISVGYLPPQRFFPVGADAFEDDDGEHLKFNRTGSGRPASYTLSDNRLTGLTFTRVRR